MSTYISNASDWPSAGISSARGPRNNNWAHLVSNSLAELHGFARSIGLTQQNFVSGKLPHYNLTLLAWDEARRLGATQVTRRQLLAIARSCASVSTTAT